MALNENQFKEQLKLCLKGFNAPDDHKYMFRTYCPLEGGTLTTLRDYVGYFLEYDKYSDIDLSDVNRILNAKVCGYDQRIVENTCAYFYQTYEFSEYLLQEIFISWYRTDYDPSILMIPNPALFMLVETIKRVNLLVEFGFSTKICLDIEKNL